MKAATSLMKWGLIAHSTETVATTAVTIAGIAATSENSATKRLCSRAPRARRPSRRAKADELDPDQDDQDDDDQAVADQQDPDDRRGRQDRREAGENEEGGEREEKRRADDDHPEAAGRPAVVEERRAPRVDRRSSQNWRTESRHLSRNGDCLAPQWQIRNDVAKSATLRTAVGKPNSLAAENGVFWGGGFTPEQSWRRLGLVS